MRGIVWSRPEHWQKQEVGAGGCARCTQVLLLLAEEENDRGVAVVGWARWLGRQLGRPGGLPAQELGQLLAPGKSFSPSLLIVFFLFSIIL